MYLIGPQTGFPGGSVVKNPPANVGDMGLMLESGRFCEGNGNPLQYSCLENPCLWGPKESDTTEQLNNKITGLQILSPLQTAHKMI